MNFFFRDTGITIQISLYQLFTEWASFFVMMILTLEVGLGVIQQLRGHNFGIFCPPPPLGGQFLYPERGQKQTFIDPLSP